MTCSQIARVRDLCGPDGRRHFDEAVRVDGAGGDRSVEIAQVKGADLEGRDLRNADASGAFLVKAKL